MHDQGVIGRNCMCSIVADNDLLYNLHIRGVNLTGFYAGFLINRG